ncbi:MAG TPA: toll/interleukin-1 receptor domain-containing protein [Thermoanaerobaculia bacterium]|jgi:hypothetical protein|nr:toll/interleukin-1 receptor domain-containing protein [Thermoanaerobaculia bacterium]
MRIFVSHSSENKEFADLSREAFEAEGFNVLIDENIPPGTLVEHAISSLVNDAQLLLLVVSRHSLASEWVQFECATFLAREKENPDLHVIPVLLDDSTLPAHLARYQVADFRVPDRYPEKLRNLAKDLRAMYEPTLSPRVPPLIGGGPKASAELRRMEEMIQKSVSMAVDDFKGQLRGLFDVFQKQQYLMTPRSISVKETTAVSEIWVITTHLYNDTKDPEFQAAIDSNFGRGIRYKYFVDKRSPLIMQRLPDYEARFAKFSTMYKFIALPNGLVMPFDELVLYDPLEVGRIWGYAQMNYPVTGQDDDNLFLKLSTPHSISIVSSLRHLAYPEPRPES